MAGISSGEGMAEKSAGRVRSKGKKKVQNEPGHWKHTKFFKKICITMQRVPYRRYVPEEVRSAEFSKRSEGRFPRRLFGTEVDDGVAQGHGAHSRPRKQPM